MKTIHVPVAQAYDVMIERGLIRRCGAVVHSLTKASACAVITDDRVGPLYGDIVRRSLEEQGLRTEVFTFPHGESSKNAQTLMSIYSFLCEKEITRSDCLIALGGGVVGDITGFAAATFLRGLPYVQIPTSLLAQVDSSDGGKTAIDLPEGKNLVGAFKQPLAVLCDPDTLRTLPGEFLTDGMGEVIKYGMIADEGLFSLLESCDIDTITDKLDTVIEACVRIKRDVVAQDELDTGLRMILNFGHSLGHAIESYYHYETYTHGCAVAAGMCLMTRYTAPALYERLCACVRRYGLPDRTDAPLGELTALCGGDKKRAGSRLRYIVCDSVGTARIREASLDEFRALFA